MKDREETVTTPAPEESEQTVVTPPPVPKEPTFHERESPSKYPFEDHPETSPGAEDGSVIPPTNKSQCVPLEDPFSRFWLGHTADISGKNKRRHRWLIRKPEHRHSINTAELERQVLDFTDQNFIVDV